VEYLGGGEWVGGWGLSERGGGKEHLPLALLCYMLSAVAAAAAAAA
jgi:hypothetical protein